VTKEGEDLVEVPDGYVVTGPMGQGVELGRNGKIKIPIPFQYVDCDETVQNLPEAPTQLREDERPLPLSDSIGSTAGRRNVLNPNQ